MSYPFQRSSLKMSMNASGSKIPTNKLVHDLKASGCKEMAHRWHLSQTITLRLTIIPFLFPHFITSMSKTSRINKSICRVTPSHWKSVIWWHHVKRDNVQFHKAWHLQPCYKLQWCQCQEKKLAFGLVSSWPQLLTARNCIQNPVLQSTGNIQERSSIYLKLQWSLQGGSTYLNFPKQTIRHHK